MNRTKRWVCAMVFAVLLGAPAAASADIFTFYAEGKGNTFGGTGDVFQNFDGRFGGGAVLGIEVIGIDLFGEAILMGIDQYLFTANLGLDVSFGKTMRFTMGAFTGPIFFLFPETDAEVGGLDFSALSADEQTALEAATGKSLADAEAEFTQFTEAEKDLSRTAIGWNLVRAKVDVDFRLAPGVYFGVGGQVGYHQLISGQEIAAGAKNEALDQFAEQNNLPDDVKESLRGVIGAEPIDQNNLDGLNYEVGLHLRIEVGG